MSAGTFEKEHVTIYEVAHVAGVSLATVSRVINHRGNVTEATRQKVEAAITKLGYKPSQLAQSLATSRSTNIAILIPSPNYVYISNILAGMIDVSKIYGYRTNVFTCDGDADAGKIIDKIVSSRVDGVVVFHPKISQVSLDKLDAGHTPYVQIESSLRTKSETAVHIDFETPLENEVERFLEQGETDIAYVGVEEELSERFFRVVSDTFARHQLTYTKRRQVDDSYHTVYDLFANEFKRGKFHHVYITPRDSLAVAISNAASDNGYLAGRDFQVLACIGTKYSTMARPQITSMEIDMYEVGSIAMRMMTKKLNSSLVHNDFHFQCEFVHRASTK